MTERVNALDKSEGTDLEHVFNCGSCGLCVLSCPIFQETGRESDGSRGRIQLLRALIEGKLEITDNLRDKIYACLGCNSCTANCPSGVNVEELINEARAALREKGVELPTLQETLRGNLAGDGNPFGEKRGDRGAWLPEALRTPRESETCIHAGCAISYANTRVGKTVLRVLDKADIDFTLMGSEEECCGDPLERLGETALADGLHERNEERWRKYGVKRIVTPCAGCVKSIRRSHPDYEVLHIVEWVAELIADGRLKPTKPIAKKVVYFDGCDMGRHADIYEPPRDILKAIPELELIDYDKNRQFAQCCGGPMMANNPDMSKSIAGKRVAEALAKGAETIATACPTCFISLRDGARYTNQRVEIQDVMSLLYKSLG